MNPTNKYCKLHVFKVPLWNKNICKYIEKYNAIYWKLVLISSNILQYMHGPKYKKIYEYTTILHVIVLLNHSFNSFLFHELMYEYR